MRIGIEAQRLLRPHKHGMDIVALEALRALVQHPEHEFFVFVKPDTARAGLPTAPNLTLIELPGGPYPIWEQYALPKAVRDYNLDLLHCTANTAPVRCSVPVVLTLHDIIFLEKAVVGGNWYQRLGNLYRRWNVLNVVKTAHQIITVSDFERQRIIDHMHIDPARIVTIHNAVSPAFRLVDEPARLADVRVRYKLPDQFIFFLGNTDPKKNVPNVLKALLLLKKRGQLSLPFVMSNVSRAYVEGLLNSIGGQTLSENIILSGYIPNAELPLVYNCATVFMCPSLRESFGLPILESMACGTPVLTASTSAMPEVAGDAALLADPASPRAMADQLHRLLTDAGLRADLRRRGLARAAGFSWQHTACKLLEVYKNCR
ncbi:glycosyltransferase family 4 protein [Spirosoma montaniterrae]|uniref:Group 1 glycosyl transferase n=1 Tax=Spirosoma montaniterrae TaxID=1178516 RepID=A0A1P9WZL8_9BACT|nr:glycosyltransferase family 1 protein [Spirosoma montaniterrae]AQG80778.1 group 1 glycosyl transferase [Spirosoma montaniterrae]